MGVIRSRMSTSKAYLYRELMESVGVIRSVFDPSPGKTRLSPSGAVNYARLRIDSKCASCGWERCSRSTVDLLGVQRCMHNAAHSIGLHDLSNETHAAKQHHDTSSILRSRQLVLNNYLLR